MISVCDEFGLGLSVVQSLVQHYKAVRTQCADSFCYFGERTWKLPVQCCQCGCETTVTTDSLCRACWLGPTPIDHWQALEHIRCDRSAPESSEVCATRSEMAAVDFEVRERLKAPEVVFTPERLKDLSDLLADCFGSDL